VNENDDVPRPMAGGDQEPTAVPHTQLSAEALDGVIKAFVLQEGTDYGEREFTLEQKIAHVRAQLESGDAQILFDPQSEGVGIVKAPQRRRP
jgi:uncharacterized protein